MNVDDTKDNTLPDVRLVVQSVESVPSPQEAARCYTDDKQSMLSNLNKLYQKYKKCPQKHPRYDQILLDLKKKQPNMVGNWSAHLEQELDKYRSEDYQIQLMVIIDKYKRMTSNQNAEVRSKISCFKESAAQMKRDSSASSSATHEMSDFHPTNDALSSASRAKGKLKGEYKSMMEILGNISSKFIEKSTLKSCDSFVDDRDRNSMAQTAMHPASDIKLGSNLENSDFKRIVGAIMTSTNESSGPLTLHKETQLHTNELESSVPLDQPSRKRGIIDPGEQLDQPSRKRGIEDPREQLYQPSRKRGIEDPREQLDLPSRIRVGEDPREQLDQPSRERGIEDPKEQLDQPSRKRGGDKRELLDHPSWKRGGENLMEQLGVKDKATLHKRNKSFMHADDGSIAKLNETTIAGNILTAVANRPNDDSRSTWKHDYHSKLGSSVGVQQISNSYFAWKPLECDYAAQGSSINARPSGELLDTWSGDSDLQGYVSKIDFDASDGDHKDDRQAPMDRDDRVTRPFATRQVPDDRVTKMQVPDGRVTRMQVPDGRVTRMQVPDGRVTRMQVPDGCVTRMQVPDGSSWIRGTTKETSNDSTSATANIAAHSMSNVNTKETNVNEGSSSNDVNSRAQNLPYSGRLPSSIANLLKELSNRQNLFENIEPKTVLANASKPCSSISSPFSNSSLAAIKRPSIDSSACVPKIMDNNITKDVLHTKPAHDKMIESEKFSGRPSKITDRSDIISRSWTGSNVNNLIKSVKSLPVAPVASQAIEKPYGNSSGSAVTRNKPRQDDGSNSGYWATQERRKSQNFVEPLEDQNYYVGGNIKSGIDLDTTTTVKSNIDMKHPEKYSNTSFDAHATNKILKPTLEEISKPDNEKVLSISDFLASRFPDEFTSSDRPSGSQPNTGGVFKAAKSSMSTQESHRWAQDVGSLNTIKDDHLQELKSETSSPEKPNEETVCAFDPPAAFAPPPCALPLEMYSVSPSAFKKAPAVYTFSSNTESQFFNDPPSSVAMKSISLDSYYVSHLQNPLDPGLSSCTTSQHSTSTSEAYALKEPCQSKVVPQVSAATFGMTGPPSVQSSLKSTESAYTFTSAARGQVHSYRWSETSFQGSPFAHMEVPPQSYPAAINLPPVNQGQAPRSIEQGEAPAVHCYSVPQLAIGTTPPNQANAAVAIQSSASSRVSAPPPTAVATSSATSSVEWSNFNVHEAYDALEMIAPTLDLLSPALRAIIAVARKRGADTPEAIQLFIDPENINLISLCLYNFKIQMKNANATLLLRLLKGFKLGQDLLRFSKWKVKNF